MAGRYKWGTEWSRGVWYGLVHGDGTPVLLRCVRYDASERVGEMVELAARELGTLPTHPNLIPVHDTFTKDVEDEDPGGYSYDPIRVKGWGTGHRRALVLVCPAPRDAVCAPLEEHILRRQSNGLGGWEEDEVWAVLIAVSKALDALHSNNVVHGAVRACNIELGGNDARLAPPAIQLQRTSTSGFNDWVEETDEPLWTPKTAKDDIADLGLVAQQMMAIDLNPPPLTGRERGKYSIDLCFLVQKLTDPNPAVRPDIKQVLSYNPVRSRERGVQPLGQKERELLSQLQAAQAEAIVWRNKCMEYERRLRKMEDREGRLQEREKRVEHFLQLYNLTAAQLDAVPTDPGHTRLFLDYYKIKRPSTPPPHSPDISAISPATKLLEDASAISPLKTLTEMIDGRRDSHGARSTPEKSPREGWGGSPPRRAPSERHPSPLDSNPSHTAHTAHLESHTAHTAHLESHTAHTAHLEPLGGPSQPIPLPAAGGSPATREPSEERDDTRSPEHDEIIAIQSDDDTDDAHQESTMPPEPSPTRSVSHPDGTAETDQEGMDHGPVFEAGEVHSESYTQEPTEEEETTYPQEEAEEQEYTPETVEQTITQEGADVHDDSAPRSTTPPLACDTATRELTYDTASRTDLQEEDGEGGGVPEDVNASRGESPPAGLGDSDAYADNQILQLNKEEEQEEEEEEEKVASGSPALDLPPVPSEETESHPDDTGRGYPDDPGEGHSDDAADRIPSRSPQQRESDRMANDVSVESIDHSDDTGDDDDETHPTPAARSPSPPKELGTSSTSVASATLPQHPPSSRQAGPPPATPPRTHEELLAWHINNTTPRSTGYPSPLQLCRLTETGQVVKPWQRRSLQQSLRNQIAELESMEMMHRANSSSSAARRLQRRQDFGSKLKREQKKSAYDPAAAAAAAVAAVMQSRETSSFLPPINDHATSGTTATTTSPSSEPSVSCQRALHFESSTITPNTSLLDPGDEVSVPPDIPHATVTVSPFRGASQQRSHTAHTGRPFSTPSISCYNPRVYHPGRREDETTSPVLIPARSHSVPGDVSISLAPAAGVPSPQRVVPPAYLAGREEHHQQSHAPPQRSPPPPPDAAPVDSASSDEDPVTLLRRLRAQRKRAVAPP